MAYLGPFNSLMRSSTASSKSVTFSAQPHILHIEPRRRTQSRRLNMEKQLYEKYEGSQVTESMLQEASQLFSDHYGIWGEHAAQVVGEFAKAGKLALKLLNCLLRNTR